MTLTLKGTHKGADFRQMGYGVGYRHSRLIALSMPGRSYLSHPLGKHRNAKGETSALEKRRWLAGMEWSTVTRFSGGILGHTIAFNLRFESSQNLNCTLSSARRRKRLCVEQKLVPLPIVTVFRNHPRHNDSMVD